MFKYLGYLKGTTARDIGTRECWRLARQEARRAEARHGAWAKVYGIVARLYTITALLVGGGLYAAGLSHWQSRADHRGPSAAGNFAGDYRGGPADQYVKNIYRALNSVESLGGLARLKHGALGELGSDRLHQAVARRRICSSTWPSHGVLRCTRFSASISTRAVSRSDGDRGRGRRDDRRDLAVRGRPHRYRRAGHCRAIVLGCAAADSV